MFSMVASFVIFQYQERFSFISRGLLLGSSDRAYNMTGLQFIFITYSPLKSSETDFHWLLFHSLLSLQRKEIGLHVSSSQLPPPPPPQRAFTHPEWSKQGGMETKILSSCKFKAVEMSRGQWTSLLYHFQEEGEFMLRRPFEFPTSMLFCRFLSAPYSPLPPSPAIATALISLARYGTSTLSTKPLMLLPFENFYTRQ